MQISDKNREQLDILKEECAEVIQAASKITRFGADERSLARLTEEIGDLFGILEWVIKENNLSLDEIEAQVIAKQAKMLKYTQYQD